MSCFEITPLPPFLILKRLEQNSLTHSPPIGFNEARRELFSQILYYNVCKDTNFIL